MAQKSIDKDPILANPQNKAVNGFLAEGDRVFDAHRILHDIKHYLPSQAALRDFIHHNSLHAYQHLKFYEAIFRASKIFGYQVTLELADFRELLRQGRIREAVLERVLHERKGPKLVAIWREKMLSGAYDTHNAPRIGQLRALWKTRHALDLDALVHPLLFRVVGSYLDQGVALWRFPMKQEGFWASLRDLENNGVFSLFRSAKARQLFLEGDCTLEDLLAKVVGPPAYHAQYLFDQQFAHQGWSGIVSAVEDAPGTLLDTRRIKLEELIRFELLLEVDALERAMGPGWEPLCEAAPPAPTDLFAEVPASELQEVLSLWQDAFEWSYYDEVLAGIAQQGKQGTAQTPREATFQAVFCIDERECSLRRHIERVDPNCATFGMPGFFGVEFYFQAHNGQFYEKLCPAPVTPKYLIKEQGAGEARGHEPLYTPKTHALPWSFFLSIGFGLWALLRLFLNLFRPKMELAISNAFAHMHETGTLTIENTDPEHRENGLQIGFTVAEMAARVEGQLRGMGLLERFAPLIYIVAHGSSSANNPHHGAHDCGACSGRPGSVNARVFAFMANHPKVRAVLRDKGIDIPDTTQFVGGLHDTAADEIGWFDTAALSPENQTLHRRNVAAFEQALDLNAHERSRRFASINTQKGPKHARKAIKDRSVSMFEPRPELGHGTNALCIVGRRDLTKGLFLDRRAFLNSFDYRTDPEGKFLQNLMRPLGPVCGGINLEYYFSRVDNYKLGAGTKLPHHVMGLIGVSNSCDGDLRPGLPVQMIEVHDPVRLLIIVEHRPEVVLKTIQSAPEMYEWFINEWVHLVALDPDTHQFFYFKNGAFVRYEPLTQQVPANDDFQRLFERSLKMETNHILDATRENLPVYAIQ